MVWCTRHKFLENVQPRYSNHRSWIFQFHEKKAAAVKRAWPDVSSYTTDSFGSKPTLFIEEALSNLGLEQTDSAGREEVNISCLQDGKSSLILQSSIDATSGNDAIAYYPFENVRAATDILFLHGTSDMVVAKHAIVSLIFLLFPLFFLVPIMFSIYYFIFLNMLPVFILFV